MMAHLATLAWRFVFTLAVVALVLSLTLRPTIKAWIVVQRKKLARRRSIVIGRHPFASIDAVRSLVFSVLGAKRTELILILLFFLSYSSRRWVLRCLFGSKKTQLLTIIQRHFARRLSTWIAAGALGWYAYWRSNCCERAVVSFRRTFWNVAIVEKAGLAKREFRPVFWLTSRHAQTVIAHILADLSFMAIKPIKWHREVVRTFDGGEVHLDWCANVSQTEFEPYGDGLHAVRRPGGLSQEEEDGEQRPVVLLLYGVGGTRDDHYMKHMAMSCRARGWRAVVLTYWRLDWNEHRDLESAIEAIAKRHPEAPIFAVAHSASAYMLVQYLSSVGDKTRIVAAVTLAGCLDFVRAYEFVKRTKNRSYRKVFDRGMRRCVRRHAAHDPALGEAANRSERVNRLFKIKAGADVMYDRHIATAPIATHLHDSDRDGAGEGYTPRLLFQTKAHYETPSRTKLQTVKVPLLVVHARDDPLVSHDDCYDWEDAVANPCVVTVRTNRGGHLGWHEGFVPVGASWGNHIATDYISAVLEQTAQTGYLCAVFETLSTTAAKAGAPMAARIAHAAASRRGAQWRPTWPSDQQQQDISPHEVLDNISVLFTPGVPPALAKQHSLRRYSSAPNDLPPPDEPKATTPRAADIDNDLLPPAGDDGLAFYPDDIDDDDDELQVSDDDSDDDNSVF